MPRPAAIALHTLGSFSLTRDGVSCDLAYEKGRALLAYLALESGRPQLRSSLAELLWPGHSHKAALNNLRQVLLNLRQTLDHPEHPLPSPLKTDRETVRIDFGHGFSVDAIQFGTAPECLDQPFPAHCLQCQGRMESLVALYRGQFLAGLSLPDCSDFEDWLLVRRETLHQMALMLMARLSDCYEKSRAYVRALPVATRFMELEPWSDEGVRRVMRLYALSGQRTNALARYESFSRIIKRDLGVLPSEETRRLAEKTRQGNFSSYLAESTVDQPQGNNIPVAFAERRQVTVLYCELSAPAIDDPDEALNRLRDPQERCIELIRSFSGFIVQAHGGGLLAYFGYPQASENAARCAVQAALSLCRGALNSLELRVGIHTGIIIGGNLQMPDPIGATSGLAVRLRQVAESGEVVVSEATYPLVSGYFISLDLGARQLRGLSRPVRIYKVLRENGARDRIEAQSCLSPLVGRKEELQSLISAWESASSGQPRTILLQGEAGVGKTRLIYTLKKALRSRSLIIRELRCAPEYAQTPFQPLKELFSEALGFRNGDSDEVRFEKLVSYIGKHYSKPKKLAVALVARLLNLPLAYGFKAPDLPGSKLREMTFSLLLERQHALAQQQPFLLIVEDVHWADPSTLDLLRRLATKKHTLPILSILTMRTGFKLGWNDATVESLPLDALDNSEIRTLVMSIGADLEQANVQRIVSRADGNPLFAEELVYALAGNEAREIPATLDGLLSSRLDALGSARIMVQMAATIGRSFSIDMFQKIASLDAGSANQILEPLIENGLLRRIEDNYQFRHALMRDAVYHSQARSEREAMHRRIATVLSEMCSAIPPEVMARHWAGAGDAYAAVRCWIRAGHKALASSACREAISHFESGLSSASSLPLSAERLDLELELHLGQGTASSALQGYATTSGLDCFQKALELDMQNMQSPAVFQAIWRLWAGASSHGGYARALDLANHLLRRAEDEGSADGATVHAQQAHFALANTLFWQGQFERSREHLNLLEAAYRPEDHVAHISGFGEDVGVTGASYYSWVLWVLGFPDQALLKSQGAVKRARKLKHPFSLGYALTFAVLLRCRMGQADDALVLVRELLPLARQHHFPLWEIGGELGRGWAMAMQGIPESVDIMPRCVDATREIMGGVTLVVLAPLVEVQVRLGHYETALELCGEARTVGRALGDAHVEAELLRLEGESLLGLEPARRDEAEQLFEQSLALARSQQARMYELRAAMNLATLWKDDGRLSQAQALLEDVVHGFSEGFGAPELRSARAFLDALVPA